MRYNLAKTTSSLFILAAIILSAGLKSPVFAQIQYVNVKSYSLPDTPVVNQSMPSLHIETFMRAALFSGQSEDNAIKHNAALLSFYEDRRFEPYWTEGFQLNSQGIEMLKRIEFAWTHGLNPNQYHYQSLASFNALRGAKDIAHFEMLLTDAFIKYAQDLTGMRIDPDIFNLEPSDWRQPEEVSVIIEHLKDSTDFKTSLQKIEPQGHTYKALRQELIALYEHYQGDMKAYEPVRCDGLIKPGRGHHVIKSLRKRFNIPAPSHDSYVYDDRLASKIMEFQKAHGLNPDGIIGDKTKRALNKQPIDKVHQIVANLERLRWTKMNRGDRYVIVNVPSAMLWAIEDNQVALEMPVIVGKPKRKTQIFQTEITGVRINPTWTIPPTIKRVDIWPQVQEDPEYLVNKGIELIDGYGPDAMTLDPYSIDWLNISARELHAIRMVQVPGDHNPLGRFRVLMPNKYNIYLHDTNHPEYFSNPNRALSSGCVRLKHPEAMAEFIMKGSSKWNAEDLPEILDSLEVTEFRVREKIPVQILYYTMWLEHNRGIIYGEDIYGFDRKLINTLTKLDEFQIPLQNESITGQKRMTSMHLTTVQ